MDDATLLARLSGGDLEALGILYDRFQNEVRRLVHRLGMRDAEIDDVVQLVFLDVMKVASRYDGRTSAKPWILGIATNIVRRQRRSLRRLAANLAGAVFEAQKPVPRTPDALFDREDSQRRFEQAIARLSTKKREVFVLVVLEGVTGEEVARALGIPVATVWTRLHHARRELREALEEVR
jgi:RNA polymerase sigma-70 factor (ECF subfamily)